MKTRLLCLLTMVNMSVFAQISFEEGYYITNANQRIEGLIKNQDWKNNPKEFSFKTNTSEVQTLFIDSIKEFGVNDESRFIRFKIMVDKTSQNIDHLTNERAPIFTEELVLLKQLVEGETDLFKYEEGNIKRFFYRKGDNNPKQLVYKLYTGADNTVQKNEDYKQQILTELACENATAQKINTLKYDQASLLKYFTDYNQCRQVTPVIYKAGTKDIFNLSLRPRVNFTQYNLEKNPNFNLEMENKIGFGVGVEAELVLPFSKGKWSIILEPTYKTLKTDKVDGSGVLTDPTREYTVKYNCLEFPIGVRYYFFLNPKSKVFLNAQVNPSLAVNSTTTVEPNPYTGRIFKMDVSGINATFGAGYKFADKVSIEARYDTPRPINYDNLFTSHAKNFSIVFGYTLF